jgi:hypothetical protein
MAIYLFCAALRELLLQVEPLSDGVSRIETTQPLERWALMQKTPGNGLGTAGGEWFTSAVDLRELEAARKSAKIKNGQTLLSSLAQGSKFGELRMPMVTNSRPRAAGHRSGYRCSRHRRGRCADAVGICPSPRKLKGAAVEGESGTAPSDPVWQRTAAHQGSHQR